MDVRVVAPGGKHVRGDVVRNTATTTDEREGANCGESDARHVLPEMMALSCTWTCPPSSTPFTRIMSLKTWQLWATWAVSHQQVAVVDPCDSILFVGPAVDRHSFAKLIVIADFDGRVAIVVCLVLRFPSDDTAGPEAIVFDRSLSGP